MKYAGLIPAYAGSTYADDVVDLVTAAHPRLRGEHLSGRRMILLLWGSSPLTRGALKGKGKDAGGDRLIPAYAGST